MLPGVRYRKKTEMKKSRSPKKGKAERQSSERNGSILDLFKKQKQKSQLQKQSELNWIESKQMVTSSGRLNSGDGDTAAHVCLSADDAPSTSAYFPAASPHHPHSQETEHTSKLSLIKRKSGNSLPKSLKRKSSGDAATDIQHSAKKTTSAKLVTNPDKNKTSESNCDTTDTKDINASECTDTSYSEQLTGDLICIGGEASENTLTKPKSKTDKENTNLSQTCVSSQESRNEPGPSRSISYDKNLSSGHLSTLNNETFPISKDSNAKEKGDGTAEQMEKEEGSGMTREEGEGLKKRGEEGQRSEKPGEERKGSEKTGQEGEGSEKTGEEGEESEKTGEEVEEYRVPYYLENFVLILNTVISDEFYSYLFNTEDREVISTFTNLSESGQKLYVRLFGRMLRWLRKGKIVYPKIAEDLTDTLNELCESKLVMSESEMNDLEDVLKSLPAPDIKTVAKSLKLSTGLGREDGIAAILKHTQQANIGSFFALAKPGKVKGSSGGSGSGMSALKRSVLQRSKRLLGSCYRLRRVQRTVFMRVLMLFGLHNTRLDDSERDTGQQQIFQMLMSNIGRVKYPEYKIHRETKIFRDRESLVRFTHALQMETDIHEALEKKEFDEAMVIYTDAVRVAAELHADEDILRHDESLPQFLRCYTAGGVYTRVLSYGVELLQFTKQYEQAAAQLVQLIDQQLYHLDYRGRWCERLALNLDFHLKQPDKALDVIKRGLADEEIRKGHRYALFQRAQKICQTASNKLKARWAEFAEDVMNAVQQAPEVHIQARKQEVPGGFPLFISEDSYTAENEHVTFMKRVEDVALQHYAKNGYPHGIHAEGSSLSFFFGLFLWDVLFDDGVPDAFYNLYQTHPLDYYSLHFYRARRDSIDKHLAWLRNAALDELEARLREQWDAHEGTFCIGVNWEVYSDRDEAAGLLRCMGGAHLAAICERFATDLRFTRSGLPDLTVWNTETGKFKVVEVKGPGDRLSTKQILWLDYFLAVGIDAEVCYVKAIGAKKLQPR